MVRVPLFRIDPAARKINPASPPLVFDISAPMVMSPACVPVLPVFRMTVVPLFRALLMVVFNTVALSPVGVKMLGLPPSKAPFVVLVLIVRLRGSNSHVPA